MIMTNMIVLDLFIQIDRKNARYKNNVLFTTMYTYLPTSYTGICDQI